MKGQLRLLGGRKLLSPKGLGTRPTTARVREALMNILNYKLEGCHWLDLFSGSGVMGCEALQRGAKRVVAVDVDNKSAKICYSNLMTISSGLTRHHNVEVIHQEVLGWLGRGSQINKCIKDSKEQQQLFDIVYLDPPYESNLYSSVLEKLLEGNWIKKNAVVICEHSTKSLINPSSKWILKDRRHYGETALLLVTPLKTHLDDTDSMQLQKGQAE